MEALCGLTVQVPAGSIYGFLGRNGAGKTTTIKVLLGMAHPTSGSARVFGTPADVPAASVDIRRRVGFVSDEKDLFDYMTVEEMIRFTAAFFPRWRADLEQRYRRSFELPADRKIKAPARHAHKLAFTAVPRSRAAILDEPTSGSIRDDRGGPAALVVHVASEEMTVFFLLAPDQRGRPVADRS